MTMIHERQLAPGKSEVCRDVRSAPNVIGDVFTYVYTDPQEPGVQHWRERWISRHPEHSIQATPRLVMTFLDGAAQWNQPLYDLLKQEEATAGHPFAIAYMDFVYEAMPDQGFIQGLPDDPPPGVTCQTFSVDRLAFGGWDRKGMLYRQIEPNGRIWDHFALFHDYGPVNPNDEVRFEQIAGGEVYGSLKAFLEAMSQPGNTNGQPPRSYIAFDFVWESPLPAAFRP